MKHVSLSFDFTSFSECNSTFYIGLFAVALYALYRIAQDIQRTSIIQKYRQRSKIKSLETGE